MGASGSIEAKFKGQKEFVGVMTEMQVGSVV